MFRAMKERRFAKHVISQLLKSHAVISAENPDLSGVALYREVLLHADLVDPSDIDEIIWQADDSIDEWTAHSKTRLGLRQVAHFVALSQYRAAGNAGTVVSFKEIVYSLIPADM